MSVTGETNRHRRSEWTLGGLTVAAMLSTVLGHRYFFLVVENVGFVVLLILVVLFVAMAWYRYVREQRIDGVRWRVWVSLAGCIALSLAFVIPLAPIFFFGFAPRWDFRALMLIFSMASLLAGALAARPVRFPLVVGGFVITIIALILPQGV